MGKRTGQTGGAGAPGGAAARTTVVERIVVVTPGRAAFGSHMRHGRLDGYDGPRLTAPETPPQVFGIGHGPAVQQRALHERRGILQGSGLASRQSCQAAVAQRER